MYGKIEVAVLVHACDRYEFLFRGFEFFFNKYWNTDIKCNYYFATEEKNVSIHPFKNIKSGKGEWSDRLRILLENEIGKKYVIYLQEDVWFTENISAAFFNALFALSGQNHFSQVKLHSADIYRTLPTDVFIEGLNVAKIDNQLSRYLMSHQVTFWDKEFLIAQLPANENPWRNENRGTKRLKKSDPAIFHIDYFSQNHSQPINNNLAFARRSNFHTVSLNGMLNNEVLHFIGTLSDDSPENRIYAEKLLFNYQNSLTHDGREKPRQDDIFKKTKKLFLRKVLGK